MAMLGFRTSAHISQRLGDSTISRSRVAIWPPPPHCHVRPRTSGVIWTGTVTVSALPPGSSVWKTSNSFSKILPHISFPLSPLLLTLPIRSSNVIRANPPAYPLYLRKFHELENRKPRKKAASVCGGHVSDSNLDEKEKNNEAFLGARFGDSTSSGGDRRKPFAYSKQKNKCHLTKSISIDAVQSEVRKRQRRCTVVVDVVVVDVVVVVVV